jgi:hypothetical protein
VRTGERRDVMKQRVEDLPTALRVPLADQSVELTPTADGVGWARFLVHPDRADPGRIAALCDG